MTIINIPVILYLSKYAFRALKDYETKYKNNIQAGFKANDIDLPDKVDYWQ